MAGRKLTGPLCLGFTKRNRCKQTFQKYVQTRERYLRHIHLAYCHTRQTDGKNTNEELHYSRVITERTQLMIDLMNGIVFILIFYPNLSHISY